MVSPDDTIIAIATPLGNSLKGIIRLSGPKTFGIIRSSFSPRITSKQYKARGKVVEGKLQLNDITVPVACYLMKAPRSYTREDMIEIHTIGSGAMLQEVIRHFLAKGVRLAHPGEFTKRAYLNGRINLSQAEAVLDIIKSRNERELSLANKQIENHFANGITAIANRLFDLAGRIELALDFSDQDIEIIRPGEIKSSVQNTVQQLGSMLKFQTQSQACKDGIICVLCGRANAGKSSLFNRLVPDKKNIVSPVAGTTRDYIEGICNYRSKRFRIFDTAGLSGASTNLSKQSRELTNQTLRSADICIIVIDGHQSSAGNNLTLPKNRGYAKTITVINKYDLGVKSKNYSKKTESIRTSARTGYGITALKKALVGLVSNNQIDRSSSDITVNSRHRECLNKCLSILKHSLITFNNYELVALDIREALNNLEQIVGRTPANELLDNIFSRFCIGK
ncbi:MAG: tRNA uridine-5-carboxymethylaminomethyl(34) synthesis GTPase MnmE [Planctomycetota bacterium]